MREEPEPTPHEHTHEPIQKASFGAALHRFVRKPWFGALLVAIILWIVGGSVSGNLTISFLAVNATLAGFLALAGVAQMTVMASGSGSFDLSLPYVITFSAYVMSAGLVGHGTSSAMLSSASRWDCAPAC